MGTQALRRGGVGSKLAWSLALHMPAVVVAASCGDDNDDNVGATEAQLEATGVSTMDLPAATSETGSTAGETGQTPPSTTARPEPEISLCEATSADTGCLVCAKLECCDVVLACELNKTCGCYMNCIDKPWSSTASCRSQCGDPGDTSQWKALMACQAESCTHAC